MASLMQGVAKEVSSIKNTVNKTQTFLMNVQALLDTPIKRFQRMEGSVSVCEDQTVEMTSKSDSHSKKLQALRNKMLHLKGRSRRCNICIVDLKKVIPPSF